MLEWQLDLPDNVVSYNDLTCKFSSIYVFHRISAYISDEDDVTHVITEQAAVLPPPPLIQTPSQVSMASQDTSAQATPSSIDTTSKASHSAVYTTSRIAQSSSSKLIVIHNLSIYLFSNIKNGELWVAKSIFALLFTKCAVLFMNLYP